MFELELPVLFGIGAGGLLATIVLGTALFFGIRYFVQQYQKAKRQRTYINLDDEASEVDTPIIPRPATPPTVNVEPNVIEEDIKNTILPVIPHSSETIQPIAEIEKKIVINPQQAADRKRDSHREFVMQEFLSTERSYVNGLEILMENFIIPLRKNPIQYGVTVNFVQSNFGQIPIILQVNKNFLSQLEQVLLAGVDVEAKLSQIVIKWAEAFKLYTPYVNGFKKSMDSISKEQSKNERFRNFLTEKAQKLFEQNMRQSQLQSLMITPVQRLPRYKLLFENIVASCSKNDSQMEEQLRNALVSIGNVTQYCNNKEQEMENVARMIELSNELNKKDLIQPSRKLILEGKDLQYEQSNTRLGTCNLFLFNDLIVIQKKSTWKAPREIVIDSDVMIEMDEKDDRSFKITKKQLLSSPDSPKTRKRANSVRVNVNSPRSKGSYLLRVTCTNSEECAKWMIAINNTIQAIK